MKILIYGLFGLLCLGAAVSCHKKRTAVRTPETDAMNPQQKPNLYGFTFTDINGDPYDFSTLKGKKVMVVNTASQCGYTPQYKKLEALYEAYKGEGFVILGFPSDDFGGQEPGSNAEIKRFCTGHFGVRFPMMEKSVVKGADKNEVYRFLTEKAKNGVMDTRVEWNFQKYLIDRDGTLSAVYPSAVAPDDSRIVNWIEQ